MAIKPIEILIRARDEASSIFTGIQTKITAVGIAVASFFGIALFSNAVKSAAEFEAALSRVKAAAGATDEEFKLLKQAAEDAGASTKYTSVEAAAALENLAKAGLNAKDSITALPAVLSLAQAGDIGLGQSAEFVTKAVMGMGLAFDQAGRVADVLAMGANASNTSVTGLAQALSYAAPVAHSLGLSLETTVAIIGKFADAGIDASRAGTALNAVLSQFSDPSSKFREELGRAGIITNNFEKALRQLAAAGPAGEKAILAVGLEAGPALRALLGQGIGALDDLKHKLDESAGSAAKMALVMEDNLPGAMKGLGSAWDTVKNVLGAPVLPVLKEGVDQLSGALRSAVADGTVVKFGEAMAEAFRSGLKWAQDFLGQVNFSQIGDDMRDFATRTGEAFAAIGEYASAAGNSVKLVYGVMSAGANTVLGVVYLIGEAFAGVASSIQAGVALIMEGFAKVTFGAVSASFKAAAAEIRLSAEATWAASEALGAKSSAAFQRVADGAQLARDGFDGLANASTSATPAVEATGRAIGDMAKQLEAAADKTAATRKATEDKTQADNAATAAVANLKQQYAELMAQGNLQGAAEALQKLAVQTRNVADASEDAKARVEQAFKNLGMATTKDLDDMAARSKGAWETIKADGTSAASVLTQAFQVYAKAAIEAAGRHGEAAVDAVKRTLESEAAAKRLGVQFDETGKVIVKSMSNGTESINKTGEALSRATDKANDLAKALINAKYSRPGEGAKPPKPGDGKDDYDPGYGSAYSRPGESPVNGDGLTKAEYDRKQNLKGQNAVDNTLMFKLRDKGANLTAADIPELEAVLAAERKNDKMINNRLGGRAGLYSLDGLRDDSNWRQIKAQWQSFIDSEKNKAPAEADPPRAQDNKPPQQQAMNPSGGTTYVSNITIPGIGSASPRFADAGSQRDTENLLRQLAQAKGASI